jgi:hypothetical protein
VLSAETALFFVPAPAMPVPTKVRCVVRDDNNVSNTDVDETLTPGAHIHLARLIWLDGVNQLGIRVIVWECGHRRRG